MFNALISKLYILFYGTELLPTYKVLKKCKNKRLRKALWPAILKTPPAAKAVFEDMFNDLSLKERESLLIAISDSCLQSFELLTKSTWSTFKPILSKNDRVLLLRGIIHGKNDYGHGRWYYYLLNRIYHETNYKYSKPEMDYIIKETVKKQDGKVAEFLLEYYKKLISIQQEDELVALAVMQKLLAC